MVQGHAPALRAGCARQAPYSKLHVNNRLGGLARCRQGTMEIEIVGTVMHELQGLIPCHLCHCHHEASWHAAAAAAAAPRAHIPAAAQLLRPAAHCSPSSSST